MANRFFVKVFAPSRRSLGQLQKFDLDLFQPTARVNERQEFTIEGLLTLEQIGQLVESGYRVLVEEEASKRSRAAQETVEFETWIKQMEG
jgi:hypothetical protein